MHIVTCIKPIRNTLLENTDKYYDRWVMNPYDLYYFKQLKALKEGNDLEITCIGMAPSSSESVFYKALGLGADDAIIINDLGFVGSDVMSTSYILSKAISKISKEKQVDYILCGKRALGGETGQVPFLLSNRLEFNLFLNVREIKVEKGNVHSITSHNGAKNEKVQIPPASILVFDNLKLDYPVMSLFQLKKLKTRTIKMWDMNQLSVNSQKCGESGSRTRVINTDIKVKERNKTILEGDIDAFAGKIIERINEVEKSG